MTRHGSATVREATPHSSETRTNTELNALKQRALARLNDRSLDPQTRAVLRYALEVNDPWLARLVRQTEAGKTVVETTDFEETPERNIDDSLGEKIETLTEIICSAGDEPGTRAAALLVLMATLENSPHPTTLVNTAKHLAFTRCGELNVFGMVDAQIAAAENELFAANE